MAKGFGLAPQLLAVALTWLLLGAGAAAAPSVRFDLAYERFHALRQEGREPERAIAAGEAALRIAQSALDLSDPKGISIAVELAALYLDLGEPQHVERAAAVLAWAESRLEGLSGPAEEARAAVLEGHARVALRQGRTEEAAALLRRAVALYQQAHGAADPRLVPPLERLGALSDDLGRYAEADAAFTRALEILLRQAEGLRRSGEGTEGAWFAFLSLSLLETAEAARSHRLNALDPMDLSVASASANVALLHALSGSYGQAGELLVRAFEIRARALGLDHPDSIRTRRLIERLFLHEQASTSAFPPLGPGTALELFESLAERAGEAGAVVLQAQLLERLLVLTQHEAGSDSPRAAVVLLSLARVYDLLTRRTEAGLLYQDAVAGLRAAGEDSAPDLARALVAFSRHLMELDRLDEAEAMLAEASALADRLAEEEGGKKAAELAARARTALATVQDRIDAKLAEALVGRARQHNGLLEAVREAEGRHRDAPHDLAALRQLLHLYAALLGFERESGLGTNLALVASQRLAEFELRAAPLALPDRVFVAKLRALLFFGMGAFPAAEAALGDAGGDTDVDVLHTLLRELGQDRFQLIERFPAGPLTVAAYKSAGSPPDPRLLWPAYHLIAQRGPEAPPHLALGFALMRQGPAEAVRHYLFFTSLNRSRLVAIYGRAAPSYEALRAAVARVLEAGLTATQEGTP